MRTMPHNPPVKDFEIFYSVLPGLISGDESQRGENLQNLDSLFFSELAESWFMRAQLAYLFEETVDTVARYVCRGLTEVRQAFDLGCDSNPWKLWDYLLFALAVRDYSSAEFLALLPDDFWWNPGQKPVPWLVLQVKTVVSLFRNAPGTNDLLQALYQEVFQSALPEELEPLLPEIENAYSLLCFLYGRNVLEFNRYLSARMDILVRQLGRENSAATGALIDLHGLGLCRLARERGMEVTVRHAYLPLDLLMVPTVLLR